MENKLKFKWVQSKYWYCQRWYSAGVTHCIDNGRRHKRLCTLYVYNVHSELHPPLCVLIIWPWSIRKKNTIGTNCMVSHTLHNSEWILGRNNSPMRCYHLPLAYKNYFCMVWRKHVNISPCTGRRVNTNYERIASCARIKLPTRAL